MSHNLLNGRGLNDKDAREPSVTAAGLKFWHNSAGLPYIVHSSTTPTASASGYAIGCEWLDTTTGLKYINTGTATSATWDTVTTSGDTAQTIGGALTVTGALTASDTLTVDGATTLTGATTQTGLLTVAAGITGSAAMPISIIDDSATALVIKEGANAYITCDTSNSGNSVTITPACTITGALTQTGLATFNGGATVPSGQTLTVAGTLTSTGAVTTTRAIASGTALKVGGLASVLSAAGTAHTNSTDEAVLASYSIPANTINAGTIVKVRYQGIATSTNGTDTLTVNLRIGPTTLTGTVVQAHSATDVANDNIFAGEFVLIGRAAAGAAAACVGTGTYNVLAAEGAAVINNYMASTNFATNGALLCELTADWSVADPGNSCRADIFFVEVIG